MRIVAINDVYTLENLPRFVNLVRHHASTDPADRFLVTLAGDFLAPSILSSLDSGRGMIDCMNEVGVTHVILGNHEDDVPTDELRKRIQEFRGVWIDTNVRQLDPALPAFQVLDVTAPAGRTVRVGLLGVVMVDPAVYRRIPFGATTVQPPNETAIREGARLLRDESCGCVIPLTHQPMDDDRALAHAQRTPPFPLIVGGHEHVPFLEQIDGTWIIKAGSDASEAVIVELEWPIDPPAAGAPDTPLISVRLDPVAGYPEDPALRERVKGHMARVHELEAATLLTLAPDEVLSSVGTRAQQTTMGTLVCTRLRDALGADGCLINGGGIRGHREYRTHLTFGDIKNEVPFDNEVVVVRLPGRVLRDAIAMSRSNAPLESGSFLQVDDGMLTAPSQPTQLIAIAGAPLDDDRSYKIAVVRDLLMGMDHIEPLAQYTRENPSILPAHGSGREVKFILVESFALSLWRKLGGFDSVDADHDGVIHRSELEEALSRVTHERPSHLTAELLLHTLDTNHDQQISRAEALAAPGERAILPDDPAVVLPGVPSGRDPV